MVDKYEYKLKFEQMKALTAEGDYEAAAEIADTIQWRKVRNIKLLMKAGEIYSKQKRYEDAREILQMAYERSPIGRMIIYRLAEIAVKMKNFEEAEEYYEEFVEIAPHDNLKYVLRYKISKAKGTDIQTRIAILEELKEVEYTEEWAFELAYLYHKAGEYEKCIDACDELVLWFGDGIYVERALELKMLHQPLTETQEVKYRACKLRRDGVKEVYPQEESVRIPVVQENIGRFDTANLQEELKKNMQQILNATNKEAVDESMGNIHKMVQDNPFLQVVRKEDSRKGDFWAGKEIDEFLRTDVKETPENGYDAAGEEPRSKAGEAAPGLGADRWEQTSRAIGEALQIAEQKKLEFARARAVQETGDIMDRLADVIPSIDAGAAPEKLMKEEYLSEKDSPAETRGRIHMVDKNRRMQIRRFREDGKKAEMELLRRIKKAKPKAEEQTGRRLGIFPRGGAEPLRQEPEDYAGQEELPAGAWPEGYAGQEELPAGAWPEGYAGQEELPAGTVPDGRVRYEEPLQNTVSEGFVRHEEMLQDAAPEGYAGREELPEDAVPEGYGRYGRSPGNAVPHGYAEHEGLPEDALPEGNVRYGKLPEDAVPGGYAKREEPWADAASEGYVRTGRPPEDALPEGYERYGKPPEDALPEGYERYKKPPEDALPEGNVRYGKLPEDAWPEGYERYEKLPEDAVPGGYAKREEPWADAASEGYVRTGRPPEDALPEGYERYGEQPEGYERYGEPPEDAVPEGYERYGKPPEDAVPGSYAKREEPWADAASEGYVRTGRPLENAVPGGYAKQEEPPEGAASEGYGRYGKPPEDTVSLAYARHEEPMDAVSEGYARYEEPPADAAKGYAKPEGLSEDVASEGYAGHKEPEADAFAAEGYGGYEAPGEQDVFEIPPEYKIPGEYGFGSRREAGIPGRYIGYLKRREIIEPEGYEEYDVPAELPVPQGYHDQAGIPNAENRYGNGLESEDGNALPEAVSAEEAQEPVLPYEGGGEDISQAYAQEGMDDSIEAEELRMAEAEFFGIPVEAPPEETAAQPQPESLLDEMLAKQDTKEIKARQITEALDRHAEEMTAKEEQEEAPEENFAKITELSDGQKEVFSYFVPVAGMEGQICRALTAALAKFTGRGTSAAGNILIQGGRGCGKTILATRLVKALKNETQRKDITLGKIDGDKLNQKDLAKLLDKVQGGCLIIERAGEITRETAIKLSLLLENDSSGMLVIMEDTRLGLEEALGKDEGLARKFTERIIIPVFTSDELVEFGKAYAHERQYEIDNMGVLALYNRISNIQRLDQPTTLTEIKEIVDNAIKRAEKKSLKKALSILTSRRYTEDDYIILREKDFDE